MYVLLARNAGFCAGVKKAVKIAEEAAGEPGKWFTLGPLVHNDEVVDYFRKKGVEPVDILGRIREQPAGIIIRSHGTSPELINKAREQGFEVRDATCVLVKKIHEIVTRLRGEDYDIVVFGDAKHPEVEGILGWCGRRASVVASTDEVCGLPVLQKAALVSQTTKDQKEFLEVAEALRNKCRELKVFNTICSATRNRQEAAQDLCWEVDLMLVIGDRKSSNTRTLSKECQNTGVRTFQIQKASEIKPEWLDGVSKIGITAGASTPDWIIKEVLDRMTLYEEEKMPEENQETNQETMPEENQETNQETMPEENQETNQEPDVQEETPANEESFAKLEAEMADFASPSKGDVIKGKVIQVLDDEVMVDVGGKSEGIIPLREMSLQDIDSAKELVEVGDEIEVMVLKWDDDGTILLSKKKVDAKILLDELEESFKDGKVIQGTVTGSVKGGLLVDVGIVAFLPASHVEDGYVKNLDEYINRDLSFKIIEFNRNKRRGSQVVLSRKELVAEEKAKQKKLFWEEIEEGQVRKGRIKRLVDYGAFIDLGGYEGLLHVSEIAHTRIEQPSDVLQEGEELDVYILALDREKERVSLSRKKLLKSPWEIVIEKFQEGDIIEGTVVRIAPFGAFVEIEAGVDGLVHISQLANHRVEKPEDVVQVNEKIKIKILSIDPEEKRIGLSLKEAQNELENQEIEEYMENQEEND
ncbi:MAG: bifunctional 4-hydroxy-3-methylbut-2-enyl diphosphate reductase/30S ribosomal protein S1 [Syntrophomonas sp.]|uniref:bifunctional 4-hydroxy-3-methylbut-2-enyl diphosphate reductase/30S ribosomal protein S1 n=1 Tax=Syntrophomonas sp. TaxID=2053627 RepID=UPI002613651D|nr:bifunctional 4-hydroxy-3-methylbut-2-enyl diphosphate reductase/30S ribosomal protein S1 [Syntrophomonas sp.]MDD3880050.1 bifunctional 4-hydroxy-3-methylbut-2-enyl diphosphate reductase/30S ribosomal protein S1 [Syntrophomonas sp.]MDD4627312.1 bifunctional 4-hydroxy-3-methylbut-2-enyl diphosphate reductase/30S ribosomal protein S1 [Syntrophomonas sp.]